MDHLSKIRRLDLSFAPLLAGSCDAKERPKMVMDLFKVLNDHYRNDINAVWQRSQFFVAAQGGLLAFVSSNSVKPGAIKTLAIIGAILALIWLVGALSTVRWVRVWREAVVAVELEIFANGPYAAREPGHAWYHVVRPHHLSWITALLAFSYWTYVVFEGVPWAGSDPVTATRTINTSRP